MVRLWALLYHLCSFLANSQAPTYDVQVITHLLPIHNSKFALFCPLFKACKKGLEKNVKVKVGLKKNKKNQREKLQQELRLSTKIPKLTGYFEVANPEVETTIKTLRQQQ